MVLDLLKWGGVITAEIERNTRIDQKIQAAKGSVDVEQLANELGVSTEQVETRLNVYRMFQDLNTLALWSTPGEN